jgi:hypothetical protein
VEQREISMEELPGKHNWNNNNNIKMDLRELEHEFVDRI